MLESIFSGWGGYIYCYRVSNRVVKGCGSWYWDWFIVYTSKEQDLKRGSVSLTLISSDRKLRTKCLVSIVFLSECLF